MIHSVERERIDFKGNSTTIGQLNFFRWAIDNLIVDYILEHYKLIEDDMNESIKLSKVKLTNKQNRKKDKNYLNPHRKV